ncbi:hypothetical protein PVAP13_4KG212020 [Panicum virgatum]|uniref:Uncharacterized protein n=1 Tax=Panicum virgatum TaxID=38727 RepID=A0A8T0TP63_PANVG|nr:hypothetical protein PVAP13_4KG212020 [Panicum virgatum]
MACSVDRKLLSLRSTVDSALRLPLRVIAPPPRWRRRRNHGRWGRAGLGFGFVPAAGGGSLVGGGLLSCGFEPTADLGPVASRASALAMTDLLCWRADLARPTLTLPCTRRHRGPRRCLHPPSRPSCAPPPPPATAPPLLRAVAACNRRCRSCASQAPGAATAPRRRPPPSPLLRAACSTPLARCLAPPPATTAGEESGGPLPCPAAGHHRRRRKW